MCWLFIAYRDSLHQVAGEKWHMVSSAVQAEMARMAAASAWGLGMMLMILTMICVQIHLYVFSVSV